MSSFKHHSLEPDMVDRLLALPPYAQHRSETESLFMSALAEEIRFHAAGNSLYAEFLHRKDFDPAVAFRLEQIPFLPVQVFKSLGSQLITVPQERIRLTLSSSATSGIPSRVAIDQITARRQSKCMAKVLTDFLGNRRRPFLILDVDPAIGKRDQGYGARVAAVRAYLSFASNALYFMESGPDGLGFLEDSFARAVSGLSPQHPIVLFGFTYVLYGSVVQPALARGLRYVLPEGSRILHIGGWKKLKEENISREVFAADLERVFGVAPDHLVDVYGFTEQMGLNYPDCPCGCKHVPHMSRILVRDPSTYEVLPEGRSGVLEFISPLPHSYPGAAVLTDDLGEIVPGPCPCGRGGTRFRILGRLKKAEARGCGDIMGEKVRGLAFSSRSERSSGPGRLRLLAWGVEPESLPELIAHLRKAQGWLTAQPSEAIIGLVDAVAATWMANPDLAAWKYQGLFFLSRWCGASNLRALTRQALRGMDGVLDTFVAEPDRKTHFLRARPAGLVVHWLSGNVPLLAMLVLVQSLVTKNLNILKTASNNFDALETLLRTFSGKSYSLPNGYTIHGDDLLRTLGLVHYPHAEEAVARTISMEADVRIAWGSREAVDAICALPAKAEGTDIVFGPKTSFMVVTREALAEEGSVGKLLRRIATDVSSFDQAACSSPHTIFVEEGGVISPMEFSRRLGVALERALSLIPKQAEDDATVAAIQTARAVGDFLGRCWHSEGPGWTVLYDERLELARPIYSRTVTVRPVSDIQDTVHLVHKGIQTIGLAAQGDKRLAFAEAAAAAGALRFPEIGLMTSFDSPWDGMFIMDRLVHWVTLGGASSAIVSEKRYSGR